VFSSVVAVFAMIGISLVMPVVAKWMLLGRVKPGRYPLWGWFYCRWWLARKLMGLAPLDYLAGSPFLAWYLRFCGARIGRGCHLGTSKISMPDQIDIGAGTSIGYGADLVPFIVEDGWLHISPIKIGAGAFIGTNAVVMLGAQVGEGASVSEQSLVARDQVIPGAETWSGSPACRVADDDQLEEMAANPVPDNWSPLAYAGFLAGFVMLEMLPWLIFIPGALIAFGAADGNMTHSLLVFPAALVYVVTTCVVVALGKRLVMPHSRIGLVPLRSWFGLRKWFADKLMLLSLGMTNSLYATLYTAPWLRLLGARVGRRAEVSTVANIDPDLLVIGPESFVADLAVIGAARHHRGTIALGTTELGPRCFVGNAALVPSDMRLPKGSLIGVQSVPPVVPRRERPSWIGAPEHILRGVLGVLPMSANSPLKDGTSWLGSPAIFLPRRQLSEQFAESVTYRPRARLVVCRLAIEFFRVVLPATIMYASFLLGVLAVRRLGNLTPLELMLLLPGLYWGLAALATGLVAALKWLIVGRYRPRVEPMWSFFVWRTELITALYENVAVPLLLRWFTGTPLAAPLLRLFGARVGPRVYLDTTYFTEFDLVHVGADAMIGSGTSLQTHLFEDRVMKMSHVKVGAGCAVGPRSVVLYDAELETGAILDPLSLAMKCELLPANTRWRGIPGQLIE
jgi:carbonic anhydrase/acetyltransferase-like protein (isoleucine patch superfamily)